MWTHPWPRVQLRYVFLAWDGMHREQQTVRMRGTSKHRPVCYWCDRCCGDVVSLVAHLQSCHDRCIYRLQPPPQLPGSYTLYVAFNDRILDTDPDGVATVATCCADDRLGGTRAAACFSWLRGRGRWSRGDRAAILRGKQRRLLQRWAVSQPCSDGSSLVCSLMPIALLCMYSRLQCDRNGVRAWRIASQDVAQLVVRRCAGAPLPFSCLQHRVYVHSKTFMPMAVDCDEDSDVEGPDHPMQSRADRVGAHACHTRWRAWSYEIVCGCACGCVCVCAYMRLGPCV